MIFPCCMHLFSLVFIFGYLNCYVPDLLASYIKSSHKFYLRSEQPTKLPLSPMVGFFPIQLYFCAFIMHLLKNKLRYNYNLSQIPVGDCPTTCPNISLYLSTYFVNKDFPSCQVLSKELNQLSYHNKSLTTVATV